MRSLIAFSWGFFHSALHFFGTPSTPIPFMMSDPGVKVIMTNTLIQSPIKLEKSQGIHHQLENAYRIQNPDSIFLVGDSLESLDMEGVHLSLRTIYQNSLFDRQKEGKTIPKLHPYSLFHYQQLYASHYSNKIPYEDYCLLEEKFANIIISYLQDTSPRRFMFVFADPSWMSPESLVSFLTKEERVMLTRYLLIDLDASADVLATLPGPVEHRTYIWDKFNRKII